MSVLASLTATYTDSEPEGDDEEKVPEDDKSKSSDSTTSSREASLEPLVRPIEPQRVATLVSYNDDALEEDDDEPGESRDSDSPAMLDDIELPPEPSGRISPRLVEKITRLHERMSAGMDMNVNIQSRKEFRNPSIYEKLIQFCGINELGTNYSTRMYDPHKWTKESFYEELAKVQKSDMERREKEKKEKAKIEFVSGTKRAGGISDDDLKKRKSKWDQVGSGSAANLLRTTGLMHPGLTTTASGTKATVISAFGSLPKKPKI